MSPTKNPDPKLPILFNLNQKTCRIFRGFEQLSRSSVSWQVMAVQSYARNMAHVGFQGTVPLSVPVPKMLT